MDGGDVAQTVGSAGTGIPVEESAILASLGHWPGMAVSGGWNANRIQNTILDGGYRRRTEARSDYGSIRGFLSNNHPRAWRRFGDSGQVHGYDKTYTPANFLAENSNKLFSKFITNADADSSLRKRAMAHGIDINDGQAFQSGALGKFTASNKLYNSRKISEKRLNSVTDYIKRNDTKLMTHIDNIMPDTTIAKALNVAEKGEAKFMGDLVSMTGKHSATNLVGGYMSASRGAIHDTTMNIAKSAGKESWIRGAAMAERHLAIGGMEHVGSRLVMKETGKSVGLRTIGKTLGKVAANEGAGAAARFGASIGMKGVGLALPGVNVVMAAWMAYDITSGAMELAKGGVELVRDGIVSMKGQIDKPIMGMGFRDNEIAATSRARGVSAIQNSRLNGRSVLGNESAALAAHYG